VIIGARLDSPAATLLAVLFSGAAALTAVDWIDSNAKIATYRDVLLIEGAIFLLVARSLWETRHAQGG
jgi:hypothetical protein